MKDIDVDLDWPKDRKKYRSIYEKKAENRRRELKEIYVNFDEQEIERDSGG